MIFHVRTQHPVPWMTINTITHVSWAPCTRPVRVTAWPDTPAERTVRVPCGRRLLADQQCPGCRHIVVPDREDVPAVAVG